jgi:putative inorganic carbon (HCO3(-)) transporter
MRPLLVWISLAYLILLFIRPQEYVPSLSGWSLQQFTLLGATGLFFLQPAGVLAAPQIRLLAPLLFIAMLSVGVAGWWGGTIVTANDLLPSFLVAVVLAAVATRERDLRKVLATIVLCACVLVLHGHLQMRDGIGWSGAIPLEGRIYYVGILSDPNDLALLFVVALAFTLGFSWGGVGIVTRLLSLAVAAWLAYGIYLSQSRGGMLAGIGVLSYYLWKKYGKTALITAAAVGLPTLFAATRLAQLDAGEESAAGRVDAWYEGIQEFIANPVFGVGYGNYAEVSGSGLTAHNSLVLVLTELGFPGYVVWMCILYCTWLMLRELLARGRRAPEGGVSERAPVTVVTGTDHALAAGCIGFSIAAFFLSQSYKAVLFILVGLTVGRYLSVQAETGGALPRITVSGTMFRATVVSILSIIGLWVLVKVLL